MSSQLQLATPHLVLGGAKSGKSVFAENALLAHHPPYVYLATAQVLDAEMGERVRRHRERRQEHWNTLESPYQLVEPARAATRQPTGFSGLPHPLAKQSAPPGIQ